MKEIRIYRISNIFSYRIEHAFDEVLDMMISQKYCSHCRKIINAVDIHRRALQSVSFENLHLFYNIRVNVYHFFMACI